MRPGRERVTIQVFITSLVVGAISFAISLYILALIGLLAGFLKITLFGPPHSSDWPETFWWIVTWVGSLGLSVLSSRAFFHYAKRFIPAK